MVDAQLKPIMDAGEETLELARENQKQLTLNNVPQLKEDLKESFNKIENKLDRNYQLICQNSKGNC